MNKKELLLKISHGCPDTADEILALLKRLDANGEFSGPAAEANEKRFKKLCRDALMIGEFPSDTRKELEAIESTLYTHGGYRSGSGRPPLSDNEIRKPRSIKFSDEEWEEIKRRADAAGMSASEYIRAKTLN